jgi:hypothetical protein
LFIINLTFVVERCYHGCDEPADLLHLCPFNL